MVTPRTSCPPQPWSAHPRPFRPQGADPWVADRCGKRTALHYAAMRGRLGCIAELMAGLEGPGEHDRWVAGLEGPGEHERRGAGLGVPGKQGRGSWVVAAAQGRLSVPVGHDRGWVPQPTERTELRGLQGRRGAAVPCVVTNTYCLLSGAYRAGCPPVWD